MHKLRRSPASGPAVTAGSLVSVIKLNPEGTDLVFSTFFGGGGEFTTGIALDAEGNICVTDTTGSANFPITPGAFQSVLSPPRYTNDLDAFILKIADR